VATLGAAGGAFEGAVQAVTLARRVIKIPIP
jgi:hypothetical protein